MTYTDCDKYSGRLRDICEGRAYCPEKTAVWRRKEGLPVIEGVGVMPHRRAATASDAYRPHPVPPSNNSPVFGRYVGMNLAILLQQVGASVKTGCGCEEWIANCNGWGPQGCIEHRQEIIDRLADRAKTISVVQTLTVGVLMMWNGMKPTIAELVDVAIHAAADACCEETKS